MKDFAWQLRQLVGDAAGMRPFVCNGNPLTCTVALVGTNPGTATSFWEHWTDDAGFNRESWIEAYLALEGEFKRSRKAIEEFMKHVRPRIIELNAFASSSKRLEHLPRSLRNHEVYRFVMERVKPKVIVCAGAPARDATTAISMPWQPTVVTVNHYIYWKQPYIELADQVNTLAP